MRFEHESWRKLYVAESVEHRLLPLFTRAVRDYLLRMAGDDGTLLKSTKDAAGDLARVLTAQASERKQLEKAIEQLLQIEYLTLNRGKLTITRFADAQAARSPGALRQKRYRDKQKHNDSDVTEASPRDATSNVTSDETRRDETPPVVLATVYADSEHETLCPSDLATHAERAGVFSDISKSLGVSELSLRAEASKFVGYWTIGAGTGGRRRRWMAKLRQRLMDRASEGTLPKTISDSVVYDPGH